MKNELSIIKLGENNTIKSTELVEIINYFREEESRLTNSKYKELLHKNFKAKIEKEIEILKSLCLEGQLNFKPSSYVNSQNKEQPCYSLNRDGMLQMLNSESVYCRAKTIEYINSLEEKLNNKDSYMIEDPIERAKRWIQEEQERRELKENNIKLLQDNNKLNEELDYKEDVIIGLTDDIDIAEKRQILNRVVRYKGANYKERWAELYKQFEMKYHISLNRRIDSWKKDTGKKTMNKLNYIDKVMNKIPELYEIACKLYESDIKELVQQMYELN